MAAILSWLVAMTIIEVIAGYLLMAGVIVGVIWWILRK
jgi:hypothetical protein